MLSDLVTFVVASATLGVAPVWPGHCVRLIVEARGSVAKTIRSRPNLAVLDTFDSKWKIVAKRTIAEPTPRPPFPGPRFGTYDYDVVPAEASDSPALVSSQIRNAISGFSIDPTARTGEGPLSKCTSKSTAASPKSMIPRGNTLVV
jgi:hypothetical protein